MSTFQTEQLNITIPEGSSYVQNTITLAGGPGVYLAVLRWGVASGTNTKNWSILFHNITANLDYISYVPTVNYEKGSFAAIVQSNSGILGIRVRQTPEQASLAVVDIVKLI